MTKRVAVPDEVHAAVREDHAAAMDASSTRRPRTAARSGGGASSRYTATIVAAKSGNMEWPRCCARPWSPPALMLVLLMAVGSVVMWIGVPLGLIYLASRLADSSQPSAGPYLLVLIGLPVGMAIVGKCLGTLDRLHGAPDRPPSRSATGATWLRSMRAERTSTRRGGVLDQVMIVSVGLALVAFGVWFFGFAGLLAADGLTRQRHPLAAVRRRSSPSSSHASKPARTAGHSPSRIEYHAVSRLTPLTIMCWRKTPSNVKPKRSAARRERSLAALHFHSNGGCRARRTPRARAGRSPPWPPACAAAARRTRCGRSRCSPCAGSMRR